MDGQCEDGKNIWKEEKVIVNNCELKDIVEFYKKDFVPKCEVLELRFDGQHMLPHTTYLYAILAIVVIL